MTSPTAMSAAAHTAPDYPWWDMRAYEYDLPKELIAQQPAPERDASRLLVYLRTRGTLAHHVFRDLPQLVQRGDVFVVNDCRVIPARLFARRADTGTQIELLLCEQLGATHWAACVRPGRSCRAGVELCVADTRIAVRAVRADGLRDIEFLCAPEQMQHVLDAHGIVPLPPCATRRHRRRRAHGRSAFYTRAA